MFCYTSWCFYEFSRTNLLTRCHSASSLFYAILSFKKATQEIFLELDETKAEVPIFLTRDGAQSRDGGEPGASHTIGWRGQPLARATRLWGHLAHLLTPPFRLYLPLDGKTLKTRSIFHETYCKSPSSLMRDREGLEALPGTLPERGITTEGLLHHHACLWSDVWVVYLGLRVHSSS
jgi:hypothetical protein